MTGHHTQHILKPPVWLLGSTVDRMTRCARTELDVEQGRIVHFLHIRTCRCNLAGMHCHESDARRAMAGSAADKPWCMWPLHPSPACPNDNMSMGRQAFKPMKVRRACRSLADSYQDDGNVAANPITAYRADKFRRQSAFWPKCTADWLQHRSLLAATSQLHARRAMAAATHRDVVSSHRFCTRKLRTAV